LNHRQPDRVPVDFGSTAVTGIHVSAVARLRKAVLGDESYRVKVTEPYQMLGEIDDELRKVLGIDVVGIPARKTMFGFENKGWKPFSLFDGTDVQVPEDFNIRRDENGDIVIYPEGDMTVPPSGRMPKGGLFFDSIVRQEPVDDEKLDPADNLEEFGTLGEEDLSYYRRMIDRWGKTELGITLTMPGTAFGDIALVPGPWMKHPKGIRDIEEWYISTVARKDYVLKVFQKQCEIAIGNIKRLIGVLGNRVDATFITGTDFGTQRGPFISKDAYRELYKPFHVAVNKFIHENTTWKTFIHSCGSVYTLIPEFIEAGFDILNPVQCSAAEMEPRRLKKEFGKHVTFWGGGVNTQQTLPFGTPDEVYREVRERIEIFADGGGFVFDAIHNVQGNTPVENLMAMFRAIKESL
ncbi:MAG: uroporphyrinogen decarboxylase family protein, partial [Bacillota bacterium]